MSSFELKMALADFLLSLFIIFSMHPFALDFPTYFEQVQTIMEGEYDYGKITGYHGRIMYPAGATYIYMLLYYLTFHG
jgi:hypothetical protein